LGHSCNFPSTNLCEVCLQGKQIQLPYQKLPEDRKAKFIMNEVSTDVCGPISPKYLKGKRYFVSFIDHYSHFVICYSI